MFFSISPNDYAEALLDEIYGCFKYIGIPIDTVMNMSVQTRKYFISKHNHDTEELNSKYKGNKSVHLSGEATSQFTQMSITDYKHLAPK